MDRIEKEYHHFGPWLQEINVSDDIPWQYDQFAHVIMAADFKFKVPINKDRRKAKRGDLLYNQVVCLFEDKLCVYNGLDSGIHLQSLSFDKLTYVIHGGELLSSYMIVVSEDEVLKFKYNSVSKEVTEVIVNRLREILTRDKNPKPFNTIRKLDEKNQQMFRYLKSKETLKDDVVILYHQPIKSIEKASPTFIDRVIAPIVDYNSQDLMVITDGLEMIFVKRRRLVERKADVDYSFEHVFMPVDLISNVSVRPCDTFLNVHDVSIDLGKKSFPLKITEDFSNVLNWVGK